MSKMTEVKPAPAPTDLGPAGRQLWRSIAKTVAELGLQFDAVELSWLKTAAKLEDTARTLEAAMTEGEMHVRGSHGQPVLAPAWAEWRQVQQLKAMTLARVKTAVDAAVVAADAKSDGLDDIVRINRPNPYRAAALKRWHGAGA
jgi:hypothetical protein